MSDRYWWLLALLGLFVVAALPVRRLITRAARSSRTEGEALVDWIVTLREAGEGPLTQPSTTRPVGRECAVRQPAALRAAPAGAPAPTRPPQWRGSRRPPTSSRTPFVPGGSEVGLTDPATDEARPVSSPLVRTVATETSRWSGLPRRYLLVLLLLGAGVSGLLAGPVAAVACGGYGALGVRAWHRHGAEALRVRTRHERLDQLCALAADLRAGLPVPVAAEALGLAPVPTTPRVLAASAPAAGSTAGSQRGWRTGDPGESAVPGGRSSDGLSRAASRVAVPDRPGQLAQAAVRLAERTGAPLADLIERIEADARSADRGVAAAAAQAAGARATAWLLAALPLGGIGLGYGIGVDPLQVLLHTPIGAGCAAAAIALQVIGLLWADRLGTVADGAS
ncbi:type II secretion system F family protein [Micromonospora sp. DT229]|uniref:type II secretion system F family protein n=1 Tax=Micromonospora sp. DT229 TaxID=3393430 RepID=UPI003CF6004D